MAEITSLDDLTEAEAPSLGTVIALRDKLLIVQYNLLAGNGTFGGIDYQENGDVGFTATVGTKLNQLRLAIDQLNAMIADPALVNDTDLGWVLSTYDNPDIIEVDIYGYPLR